MPLAPFVTALLVRNERERYLPEVLEWHAQWGPLVILDDNSTDGTYEFCRDHPATHTCLRVSDAAPMWGRESGVREQLWQMAAGVAEWHLVADADQLLSTDPRPLCASLNVNAWAFPLYDLWDDRDRYREDQFWRGHLHPRPWLFNPHRTPDGYTPTWSGRGIHTGHAPANFPLVGSVAPERFYWLHLGYLAAQDRHDKLTRYRSQYHQMTDHEQAHAESIADPSPNLKVLPFNKPLRILVGAPVRKAAPILQAHLASLAWQDLPKRVTLDYAFVDDYPSPDPAQDILRAFVAHQGGRIIVSPNPTAGDFSDTHPVTHQWTTSAMQRVGMLKNQLLAECVNGGYDFLWLVDSDLVLDKTTLASLLAANRSIVSAVYWTRWNTDPKICAGPQVWLRPPYQLGLPHYPESEFRHALGVERGLVKVGGLGACTLIARSVIEKGVHFGKPPGFPSGGLMDGEDRHFCEWARRLHVDLWADAWPDIFHCYHNQHVEMLPAMSARLSQEHPRYANHGHLVSLKLTNIEDAPTPQHVRCRIGDGTLLPELEQAVLRLQRGETKIVRLHFPQTVAPVQTLQLAGKSKLIQVELLDCKPPGLPPVLEDEFYATETGAVQDQTHLTAEQHQQMAEAVR